MIVDRRPISDALVLFYTFTWMCSLLTLLYRITKGYLYEWVQFFFLSFLSFFAREVVARKTAYNIIPMQSFRHWYWICAKDSFFLFLSLLPPLSHFVGVSVSRFQSHCLVGSSKSVLGFLLCIDFFLARHNLFHRNCGYKMNVTK